MQKAGFTLYIFIYFLVGFGYTNTTLVPIDKLHISSFGTDGKTIYAGTWGYGVYRSDDKGKTWNTHNYGLTNMFIYSLYLNDSSFFAGTDGGGIVKYNNQEHQWISINNGNIGNVIFTVLELDGVILTSSWSHGLHRSENNGKTWEKVTEGLADSVIYSLCRSNDYLYAGGAQNGVYQSKDRGKTWTLIGLENRTITCLFPVNNHIWCGTWESGLYYYNEIGSTWQKSSIEHVENIDALSYSQERNILFCANKNDGVFQSDNYDTSWHSIGLAQYNAFSLIVLDDVLFAGTWGNGIFTLTENNEWNKLENTSDTSFFTDTPDSLKDSSITIASTDVVPSAIAEDTKTKTLSAYLIEEKVLFINPMFSKKYSIPIINEQQNSNIVVTMYDYSGQQVYTRSETLHGMEKKIISLNLKQFFAGIYVINIQTVINRKVTEDTLPNIRAKHKPVIQNLAH